MAVKGYIVRGKYDGRAVYSYGTSDGFGEGCPEISPRTFWDLDTAAGARAFMVRRGCTDVRIFAVAEDGSETPLPTYEEALEQLNRILDLTQGLGFEHPEDTALSRVEMLLTSREAIAEERDEARTGDALSEERTTALWHAVEDAAEGNDMADHFALLSSMGIDAEPVNAVCELRLQNEAVLDLLRRIYERGEASKDMIGEAAKLLGIDAEAP